MSELRTDRRTVLTGAAALTAAGFVPTAAEARGRGRRRRAHTAQVTVLGTTDLHGNVFNWDYFKNADYTDRDLNDIGLAKISTLVTAMREQRGSRSTLLIDAGDTIQGTPLAYYYAKIDPITEGAVHPMAEAMNLIGYDAAALGNHEFNYGIPLLRRFEEQCDFPLLAANAVDPATKRPAFPPYVIRKVRSGEHTIKVGILGLTNPGIAIWDKAHVEGRMEFPGLVEQARTFVPQMRRAGADIVVVAAHSGADTSSSWGDTLPYVENASTLVAEEVPGIDAILVGHAHKEIAERRVVNKATGREVLLTEPLRWGMRLSVLTFDVERVQGRWVVRDVGAQLLNANTVDEDPAVEAALAKQHDVVVDYVNSVIGTSTQAMSAARAIVEDVAAIDFVNYVQALTVKEALAGATPELPVLSIAAPFNPGAAIPAGEVTVRDVAGLYIYDNTLLAVQITGAQLRDYLEYSVRYFEQVSSAGPFTAEEITQAPTPEAPNGTPHYNYDIVAGLDAPLTYEIDLAVPAGTGRIKKLAYGGAPVTDGQVFALAINNYRQSGGGNFPHVATAPVLYNRQLEIRQLIIDWVTAQGEVNPGTFASVDWKLVYGDSDVVVSP